jgi:peptidoglycan/LPS O-acetylase OafA/YrhL
MSEESNARLQPLDAIRGIAAMMVVLFHFTRHYSKIFPLTYHPSFVVGWGYLGVHFFFMVSGFVIFMTLCKTVNGWDFVVSRFSRLYPAYWFAVLATTVVVSLYGLPEAIRTPGEILINLTMLEGFMHVRPVDGVYWTLTYELLFYAWMFLLFYMRRLEQIERFIAGWLLLAIASHIVTLIYGYFPWKLTFSLLLQYAHLFGAGILFYLIYSGKATRMTYALLGLCIIDQLLVAENWIEDAFVFGFFAVFTLVAIGKAGFLNIRPLTFLGTISYTLYLLHENMGIVLLDIVRRAGVPPNLGVVLVIFAAVGLAALVSKFIERPAMRAIRRIYKARTSKTPVPAP